MYQFRLYNSREIEKLNHDLEVYKKAAESKDANDSIKYTEMKQELELLKRKVLKDKGEMRIMKETYQSKINSYELKEQKLAKQIQAVNYSMEQLKNDVQTIKGEVKELRAHELLEKMDEVLGKTDNELNGVKEQIKEQKTEFDQIRKHFQPQNNSGRRPSNGRSEFRQLQQMLKSVKPKEHKTPPSTPSMITASLQRPTMSKDAQMIAKSGNKKTFHNTRYEFNKNIITKKTTTKTKQRNMENEKEQAAEENPKIKSQPEKEAIDSIPMQEKPKEKTEQVFPEDKTKVNKTSENKSSENNTKVEEEVSAYPAGLKKTWMLAKSLWKK